MGYTNLHVKPLPFEITTSSCSTIYRQRGKRKLYIVDIMRSRKETSAPSWLKEKLYIKVRFTHDGCISKVMELSKLKLMEDGETLKASLANCSFRFGQKIWCYWKTTDKKKKAYFEGNLSDRDVGYLDNCRGEPTERSR